MFINQDSIRRMAANITTYKKGARLYDENKVGEITMSVEGAHTVVKAQVTEDGKIYNPNLKINPEKSSVYDYNCTCKTLDSYYGACKHCVALMNAINNVEIKRGTDNTASNLIQIYALRVAAEECADMEEKNVSLIFDKIILSGDKLSFSLKIGREKMYAIKDPFELATAISNNQKIVYGKSLSLVHTMKMFDEESLPLAKLIVEYFSGINDNFYLSRSRKHVLLNSFYTDRFFEMYEGQKLTLSFAEKSGEQYLIQRSDPEMKIDITFNDGCYKITVLPSGWSIFKGANCFYLKENGIFHICSQEFRNTMGAFLEKLFYLKDHSTYVSKKDMPVFYTNVLKSIEKYTQVNTECALEEYEPPKLEARLYLDMENSNMVKAFMEYAYDDKVYIANKLTDKHLIGDIRGEYLLNNMINKFFDYIDSDNGYMYVDGDDKIYNLITDGIEKFSQLCDVFMTDTFKNNTVRKRPVVNLGVRLESDLLNLSIDVSGIDMDELNEILNSYTRSKKYHRLKSGAFISLKDSVFEELASFTEQFGIDEITSENMKLPKYRMLYLDKMLKESQNIKYDRDGEFKKTIRNLRDVSECEIEIPKKYEQVLRDYQKTGFCWLKLMSYYNFGGILADDMGLGKTLQIIALLSSYKDEGGKLPSLVVCPASLVLNWESEINRFASELTVCTVMGTALEREEIIEKINDYDVAVTSYDLLKRDIIKYSKINFEYEIVDEAQFIKNHSTQSAKAVKLIKSSQRFALTGTPVENSLAELWSIFDFLMPGYLYNYNRFKTSFESPIVKSRNQQVAERLKKMVSPFILRRLKKDVLKELPPKTETVMYAKLEEKQSDLYLANAVQIQKNLAENIKDNTFESNKLMILAMLTRLRQLCCDPALVYSDYDGTSAKLEMCMELIGNAVSGGHKILLFSQFTSMLEIIEKKLNEINLKYYKITGATPKTQRFDLVNKFNVNDTPLFLISLKAGGTGLNLTGADIVIHYDPWWNLSAQNQATDRAHRIGQEKNVTVYKLIAKNTIEEKILKLQENKSKLAEMIISEGNGAIASMTKEDIINLFS